MTRKSINVEGFSHGGLPIPAASRVGPLLMTGGIHGLDLEAGEHGEAAEQIGRMFANLEKILKAGGCGLEAVVRMTVYVKTPEIRQAINDEWLKAFPDRLSEKIEWERHLGRCSSSVMPQPMSRDRWQ